MDYHRIHDLKYSEVVTDHDYALLAWVQCIYPPKMLLLVSVFVWQPKTHQDYALFSWVQYI